MLNVFALIIRPIERLPFSTFFASPHGTFKTVSYYLITVQVGNKIVFMGVA